MNTTTIAVNRAFKKLAAKKLASRGIPLSVATNIFFKKIIDDQINIDLISNDNFSAEEIPVKNKKIATLMDDVGELYKDI